MTRNIHLIAFGTFGSPSGFRQTFFLGGEELEKEIKTFDLKTDAIKLVPKSTLYSVRKELVNGSIVIAYSIYTYAKERNSERGGTFIGSSILLNNKTLPEHITINTLNEFHSSIVKKNVENDVINVDHSDKLIVKIPKDFDKLEFNLEQFVEVGSSDLTKQSFVIYCHTNPDKLQYLFSNSIDLLNAFDTIYFTENSDVAEFVGQKGIFKLGVLGDFEQEIQNVYDDRKRKTEMLTIELENECRKLQENRAKTISNLNIQIDDSEKKHQENFNKIEESKLDVVQVEALFGEFSTKILEYMHLLKSGVRPERIKDLYNEDIKIFQDAISLFKQPKYLNEISKPNSGLKGSREVERNNSITPWETRQERTVRYKTGNRDQNLFKALTIVLAFLWIITLIYLIWALDHNKIEQLDDHQIKSKAIVQDSLIQ